MATNTIKFSVGVFDNKNQPLINLPIKCKALKKGDKRGRTQSRDNMTDWNGNAVFEFKSIESSIEVDIEVNDYDINYAFQDGEDVKLRLLRVNF